MLPPSFAASMPSRSSTSACDRTGRPLRARAVRRSCRSSTSLRRTVRRRRRAARAHRCASRRVWVRATRAWASKAHGDRQRSMTNAAGSARHRDAHRRRGDRVHRRRSARLLGGSGGRLRRLRARSEPVAEFANALPQDPSVCSSSSLRRCCTTLAQHINTFAATSMERTSARRLRDRSHTVRHGTHGLTRERLQHDSVPESCSVI
jgi:hypothetical protein